MILSTQDIARARSFYARGFWRDTTMYMLLRALAQAAPGRFFLRDPHTRLTRAAALAHVDAIAADLHALGLRAGDRVAIWLPSRVESAIVLLACSRMGYVCSPSLHRDYTCAEIAGLLARSSARALFTQQGYGTDATRASIEDHRAELPLLRRI